MGFVLGIALPAVLVAVAGALAHREIRLYRGTRAIAGDLVDALGADLFEYTRWRLLRRLTGVIVLLATAVTLAALELAPATSITGAQLYLALLTTEALTLIILALLDLRETARRRSR
ncbi:MAG TPA: hypothetical protein VML75_09585 [Kofleriaceae bacterium]|nr:hypothetical protein [Kofleriaceae bacterium]